MHDELASLRLRATSARGVEQQGSRAGPVDHSRRLSGRNVYASGSTASLSCFAKLYARAASALNLAPNQHSEEPIKRILGVMTLVNGIGTLRNGLSDSHGRGGPLRVRPSPRHANLAINAAGAVATFLVETHRDRLK